MAQPLHAPISLADYLAAENESPLRHEYLGGWVYAMTGGSMRHNRIALNIASALMRQLSGSPCQVFINDMKLHVQAADSVYYPDVFVQCGSGVAGNDKIATDATLIVEVLSDSTAGTDRREKRVAYMRLAGLRSYWIVSQDEQRVEVHERAADGSWLARGCGAGDRLAAPSLAIEPLHVVEIYVGTDLA